MGIRHQTQEEEPQGIILIVQASILAGALCPGIRFGLSLSTHHHHHQHHHHPQGNES